MVFVCGRVLLYRNKKVSKYPAYVFSLLQPSTHFTLAEGNARVVEVYLHCI